MVRTYKRLPYNDVEEPLKTYVELQKLKKENDLLNKKSQEKIDELNKELT